MLQFSIICFSLALFLFVWGVVEAWRKTWPEIPYCLSDFFYVFGGRKDFSKWFLIITILLMIPLNFLLRPAWYLPLLLTVGCCGVGLAPDFKSSKVQHRIHMAGALLTMVVSQWIFSFQPWSFLGWSVFGAWLGSYFIHQRIHSKGHCSGQVEIEELFEGEDWLWWMELSMFVGIFVFIILGLIYV